jgi:hypothetical protein
MTFIEALYGDRTTRKVESRSARMVGSGVSWLAVIGVGHFRFDEAGSGPVIRLPW